MGVVERYPDGTFCWVDLGTNDAAGAKAFYGGLFVGVRRPAHGEQGTYSTCRLKGGRWPGCTTGRSSRRGVVHQRGRRRPGDRQGAGAGG